MLSSLRGSRWEPTGPLDARAAAGGAFQVAEIRSQPSGDGDGRIAGAERVNGPHRTATASQCGVNSEE